MNVNRLLIISPSLPHCFSPFLSLLHPPLSFYIYLYRQPWLKHPPHSFILFPSTGGMEFLLRWNWAPIPLSLFFSCISLHLDSLNLDPWIEGLPFSVLSIIRWVSGTNSRFLFWKVPVVADVHHVYSTSNSNGAHFLILIFFDFPLICFPHLFFSFCFVCFACLFLFGSKLWQENKSVQHTMWVKL